MSRYGSQDPRDGHHSPNSAHRDERHQGGEQRGGLLSRHNQQNQQNQQNARTPSSSNSRGRDSQRRPERAPANLPRYGGNGGDNGNGGASRSLRDDAPPAPRQPSSSASRGHGRPSYEPYADAPWNQSWQWSDNPQTTESQAYPAAGVRPGWDESQQWRAGQWDESAQWDASSQWGASEAWQPAAQGALGGRAVGTATKGNDDDAPQKKSWKRRLGLTRDAWQWEKLRAWPGIVRLVMAVMLAGGLVGLLTFTIRPIPVGGTPTADGSPLQGPGKGPVPTAPPSLFGGNGPTIYQPPTATPVPTKTPVPAGGLTAQPLTVTTSCEKGNLTSTPTTLSNSSSNTISFTITTDGTITVTGANGQSPYSATVPAHGSTAITFDDTSGTDCVASSTTSHSATVAWNPMNTAGTPVANGGGQFTITDTVTPYSGGPKPGLTPTATPTCTTVVVNGKCA